MCNKTNGLFIRFGLYFLKPGFHLFVIVAMYWNISAYLHSTRTDLNIRNKRKFTSVLFHINDIDLFTTITTKWKPGSKVVIHPDGKCRSANRRFLISQLSCDYFAISYQFWNIFKRLIYRNYLMKLSRSSEKRALTINS